MSAACGGGSRRCATDLKNPVPDYGTGFFHEMGRLSRESIFYFPPPGRLPDYLTGSSQLSVRNDEAGMPLVLKSEASA